MPDMAADLNPEWLSCLPSSWSYGVTRDGRVFFINEQGKSTTWLHPVTGEAVITGHRKTPDLPTGWEEGFTFEGARCFINHNERKVTCKHPVSGQPSQDNCIFVVNEHPASKMQSHEKKDRPVSSRSEASNYTMASEYGTHPGSPLARASRSLKKIHNFGKRSNSIKRNPNAPVLKRNWLYKQDSTGMKLWKKRWFVLSDMCLFYYRDEKEEGILGSILLPSFHISMLSVDDHINRKYAFKATHPNMRTYYFCTDTSKEMESWMKVMTDAALVHSEPVKRIEKLKPEHSAPQEVNNIVNHRVLTRPEALNNERNREVGSLEETTKLKDAEKYGFQKEGIERPLTKINSVKVHPASHENENSTAAGSVQGGQYIPAQVNGAGERPGNISSADMGITPGQRQQQQQQQQQQPQYHEPERALQRTSSMMQLEQWVRTHRVRGQEDETRSITSYQTLPRNMPSYRAQIIPHYPEAYRTLPRNSVTRPDSICSISASVYDRALGPVSTEDKRRSMRDDTMWQLYEWQQRQAYAKQGPVGSYGTLSSPKTMINISDHVTHSIPPSPSHGSLALYQGYSPLGSYNMGSRSEVSSPVFRGDRHHRTHHAKYAYPPDRRSMPTGLPLQPISPQVLQGKTMSHGEFRDPAYNYRMEELDIDAKLSRLCKQDKLVRTQEEKLQQLHREKHTLEQALLSASQEIEMNADNPAAIQSVIQQRDVLQNGLLSTCRERSRANAELERSWMEYDRLESEVTLAKNNLQEQLEKLGDQSESSSLHHANIQKELWRIQDVIEALGKNKPQRNKEDTGFSKPISDEHKSEEEESVPPRPPLPQSYDLTQRPPIVPPLPSDSSLQLHVSRGPVHRLEDRKTYHVQGCQRNGAHSGPDYRLYKSEPELTTVAEVDESNGEEKTDTAAEKESTSVKGSSYPVGVVSPRTKSPMPQSSTIASYVTLRKTKKLDTRTERPRSAVEQLCLMESSRPRMSVEEQMERMKRHQQASLREKKKGLNIIAGHENSPSRSPSFSKENPFKSAQLCKMEDTMSSNIKELEASLQGDDLERNHETPAQEIARLKGAGQPGECSVDKELSTPEKVLIPERYIESDPEEVLSPEESADKQKKVDRIKAILTKNSMQNAVPVVNHKTEDHTEEEVNAQEQEKILNISYKLAAEASKRSKLVAVKSLSSPPQSPTSPSSPPHPPLAEGSHFMCV
ncbi:pleckstrin homology domain-containing family A member 5-like isoform X7 [Acipenser ruthenus]|uniref:pleckstrin homology domain-containing family A member 5-like isoform X7 n=1 Tax=Acipenser ruthenus TaxID=7906 RepID=UPI00274224BB|nr:pleckstrin homology domain-containing family A member 5-like isoform X7 [Acipenser ruthenus]